MIILSILFALLTTGAGMLYLFVWHYGYLQTWLCALFLLNGIFNYLLYYKKMDLKDKKVFLMIILGLYFGMVADALLGFNFVIGGIVFAIGHMFYFLAFCFEKRLSFVDILMCAFIIGITILTGYFIKFDFGKVFWGMVFYGVVLSSMLGKALSNALFKRPKNAHIFIQFFAALLFYISDYALMIYNFTNLGYIFSQICMLTYIPAQVLFGFSIAFFKKKQI